jgi:hypothetical protein
MTILVATGEDTGVTFIIGATGGAITQNNSADYVTRSNFTRGSTVVAAFNSTNVADPPASRIQLPAFTAGNLVWLHAQFSFGVSSATTSGQQVVIFRSPDGASRVIIRQTGTAGQLKASSRNFAGSITDLATATANIPATIATVHSLDIKLDYSSSGGITAWLDGTQFLSYSGDPRTDAATQINQIELASVCGQGFGSIANGGGTGWSEIIVADEDTRGMALWTLNPQAAGNTQSWTPNTLASINKSAISDTTSISAGSNNVLSQWTTPTSPPTGNWGVKAIVQEARVRVGTSGPQHFDWSARTASTDYTAGVSNAPSTSFGNFNNQFWTTNPNTTAAWAITDIASGFNLGIKSLA